MVLESSIHGTNFKRGARSYRVFSVSLVQALHTLFECEESFYFVAVLVPICGRGTSLQLFLASFISSRAFFQQHPAFKWKQSLLAHVAMLFLGFPLAAAGVSLLPSCSRFLCL